MTVLYEDADLIAFNKPASLPTQADETGDTSLQQYAEKALNCTLFVVHRLDRPTSGIVVFAKHEQAAASLSQQFQSRETEKKYFAIVEKKPEIESGALLHFLAHNSANNKSFPIAEGSANAKRAELRFILRGSSDRYFLLELTLLTGRHHQIRAQLSAIGCPIKGDVKYGARRSNTDRSIHLHAAELTLKQPQTGERLTLRAEPLHKDALWQFFEGIMSN
ncbi:MAG: RluA family pseudouridine synthase [Saprospiraceae bacterium]|nr:RluA family pseudouridine synthase [Saprospiraceae bacterium]